MPIPFQCMKTQSTICRTELCPILINDYFKGLKLKVADVLMRPSTSSSSFEKAAASRFKLLEKQSSRPDIMQNKTVQNRVSALEEKWDKMKDLLSQRRTKLEEAIQSQQVKIFIDHYHSLLRFFLSLHSIMLMQMKQSHG